MSSLQIQYSSRSKCRKYFETFPNLTPEIYSFSTYYSNNGNYTTVYVTGKNFLLNNTYSVNVVNLVYYSPQYKPATLYSNTVDYIVF